MSALVDRILALVLVKLWPQLEDAMLRLAVKQARELIQRAKDGTFPDKWKWAEPFFDQVADEILKLLPAEFAAAVKSPANPS